jgi:hypothetical protein
MMKPIRTNTVLGAFAVAVLLGAPAHAALIVDAEGRPVTAARSDVLIRPVDLGSCKVRLHERTVRLALEPDTKLADLVARMALITCRQYALPSAMLASNTRLTIVAPELITPREASALFVTALDSAGITVEQTGKVDRLAAIGRAKRNPDSLEPTVTRLVRFEHDDPNEMARTLARHKGEHGAISVLANALIITDMASNVSRMLRHANAQ